MCRLGRCWGAQTAEEWSLTSPPSQGSLEGNIKARVLFMSNRMFDGIRHVVAGVLLFRCSSQNSERGGICRGVLGGRCGSPLARRCRLREEERVGGRALQVQWARGTSWGPGGLPGGGTQQRPAREAAFHS